jgi:hypothetical protein
MDVSLIALAHLMGVSLIVVSHLMGVSLIVVSHLMGVSLIALVHLMGVSLIVVAHLMGVSRVVHLPHGVLKIQDVLVLIPLPVNNHKITVFNHNLFRVAPLINLATMSIALTTMFLLYNRVIQDVVLEAFVIQVDAVTLNFKPKGCLVV